MNKILMRKIIIAICIVSILITSVSSLVAFGDKKVKADSIEVAHMKKYQKYLNDNYNAKLEVDGKYGCKTAQATVKVIQRLYNEVYNTKLKGDGKWGPKTRAAIENHPIKQGAKNKIVRFFQMVYNYVYYGDYVLGLDGCFGPKTAAVIDEFHTFYECFQCEHPKSTRICSRTWTFMIEKCCGNFYVCPLTNIGAAGTLCFG